MNRIDQLLQPLQSSVAPDAGGDPALLDTEPVWDFPLTAEAHAFARTQLGDHERVLLISPCSSHPARNWRAERYAAVADAAIRQHGLRVVLSGGPSTQEAEMGAAIPPP